MELQGKAENTPKRLRGMKATGVIRARDELIAHEVLVNAVPKAEMARRMGISKQGIAYILQRVKADQELIDKYNAQKSEIQAHNQMKRQVLQDKVLDSLTDKELEKADLKTKMMVLNTLGLDKTREFEAERLVRGQSTENVAVMVQAIKELKKKRKMEQIGGGDPGRAEPE